jgi:hypothetical protein
MALTPKCRVCGAAVPGRGKLFALTWILAALCVVMLLLIPTLVGFATAVGGAAILVGVFVGLLALYLYLKLGESCQVCAAKKE